MTNIDKITGQPKIILDLCGGTGAWSKPYKDAGYDVRLITLPEHDVRAYWPPENVYGILAAPPCTEFSNAKTTAPRNLEAGLEIIIAVMRIIWICQRQRKLNFWAIENPRGLLTRFIGSPAFRFEQWQFGGLLEKPTCLWGCFNAPRPTTLEKPEIKKFRNKISNRNMNACEYATPTCPPEYLEYIYNIKGYRFRRAAIRAITPPGFAQAFYRANR